MARRVFYSFHYQEDGWRASQVRNMGFVEGNTPVADNDWEQIWRGGDTAIRQWIDGQLYGRSCTILLIGAETAGRQWINYEIEQSWNQGKGLLGIYIHRLKNQFQQQSSKGDNPFEDFNVKGINLARIVQTYDPPYWDSTDVYRYIRSNLESWVEYALYLRDNY